MIRILRAALCCIALSLGLVACAGGEDVGSADTGSVEAAPADVAAPGDTAAPAEEAAAPAEQAAAPVEQAGAPAGDLKEAVKGRWGIKLSDEDQAKMDAMKQLVASQGPEAQAQAAAAFAQMSSMALVIDGTHLAFEVGGGSEKFPYTAKDMGTSGIVIDSVDDKGEAISMTVEFVSADHIRMTRNGDPNVMEFERR